MDKVRVSVEALQSAEKTLREMEERIGTIVFQHESKIKDNFDGIDENLQKGLLEHIEALKKYGPTPIHRRSFIKNFL